MSNSSLDLLRGTLDLLILRTLTTGPRHGYAIAEAILRASDDVLLVAEGALYPALHLVDTVVLVPGLVGCLAPALRATRIEPVTAVREG